MASKHTSCTRSALTPSESELIKRVHSHFPNNEPDKFHFFYATASPFSNFHPCNLLENGIQFHTTEQYMMYHKAKLFNDNETAEAILQATTPADCKALGRTVKNFDEKLWMDNRTPILSQGLYLKFTEDDQLKQALLKHYGSLLVEAAGNDGIWGVGLKQDNPLIRNRSTWKGLNLLGYILTDTLHRIHDQK
ncbi:unnamed protein product [Rotaria sp. Silwood1]|nr:unnamed protein product [Rotaria sp. Silwood1]CAF0745827.1 unnamed protein product [Rotaria sp. Silwood1]CAF0801925.1 unnamed protein product [Rotaria sp. Silwood1]CAF3335274.1 unnamed protein product [Rotaria sp. Silwood1]CAF3351576.1 unnamed protein product [Rotaria sp. Silwood1]